MKKLSAVGLLLAMLFSFVACIQEESPAPTATLAQGVSEQPVVTAPPDSSITVAPKVSFSTENGINVTIEEIDELPSYASGDWQLGMGNEDHLNSAISKILEHDFLYSESYPYDCDDKKIISDLRDILKDHDVYVCSLTVGGPIYWDSYDENGDFYGGTFHGMVIELGAGNKLATVIGKSVTFGYRFPSSTPTP